MVKSMKVKLGESTWWELSDWLPELWEKLWPRLYAPLSRPTQIRLRSCMRPQTLYLLFERVGYGIGSSPYLLGRSKPRFLCLSIFPANLWFVFINPNKNTWERRCFSWMLIALSRQRHCLLPRLQIFFMFSGHLLLKRRSIWALLVAALYV